MRIAGILAGGESRRMGSPKAELRVGAEKLLDRAVRILRGAVDSVWVSVRSPGPSVESADRVVPDRRGPPCALAGIHALLSEPDADLVLVCGVDLPYLNLDLIRHLFDSVSGHDAVVPESSRGLERLFAVYTPRCLGAIDRAFDEGRLAVPDFYRDCDVRILPVTESRWTIYGASPFSNVNTPAEFEAFLKALNATGGPPGCTKV